MKRLVKLSTLTGVLTSGVFIFYNDIFTKNGALERQEILKQKKNLQNKCYIVPSRESQIKKLKEEDQNFDIIVIGGGATGTGIALDATTRKLKVALFERNDFASGTSSKSTKMAHGGVRYLEKAVKQFDLSQMYFVQDGLQERKHFFNVAPHLVRPLPLIAPQLYVGLRLYDILSGTNYKIGPSKFLTRSATLKLVPGFKKQNLKGGVQYYDGGFNDARMNVTLAVTAAAKGAVCLNHAKVTQLIKDSSNKIIGVTVKDMVTEEEMNVYGKVVVNATGPFCDSIRLMDNPNGKKIMQGSSGVHITLNKKFAPHDYGILFPKTTDGRVLFLIPWENKTIAGTTDNPVEIHHNITPSEKEINFILNNLKHVFDYELDRQSVESAWCGIRPLAKDPNQSASNTSALSRDLYIDVSKSNLISITGGKWTCFRRMGEVCVDEAVKVGKLDAKNKSKTHKTVLIGARSIKKDYIKDINLDEYKFLSEQTKLHLKHYYGDQAIRIAELAKNDIDLQGFISEKFPFIKAEIQYQMKNEFANFPSDILCFRTNMMFLDKVETIKAVPVVVDIMAKEKKWTATQIENLTQQTLHYINNSSK